MTSFIKNCANVFQIALLSILTIIGMRLDMNGQNTRWSILIFSTTLIIN